MNDSSTDRKSTILMFMLLPLVSLTSRTQSKEDTSQGTSAPETSEEFRLLSESEVKLHHATLFDEIKEQLSTSRVEEAHKDLIADAFSKVMSGVPVGSFQRTEVIEQTDLELDECTGKFAVVENGYVENLETGDKTYFANTRTPFYHEHTLPFDFKRGGVSAQNETDITFRFFTKTDLSLKNTPQEILDALFAKKNIRWAMELSIDKDKRSLKHASFYLEKPIRKWPIYRVDTIRTTFDFGFIENCGCVGVKESNFEVSGSVISVGRLTQRTTETFSDVECAEPKRFLLPLE
ncbi:MAG: hypothetical protein F4W92_09500 [Gammaproteobacteria bacterium]|nr:hypothetical protein [Gammaproteobacteria bacterium]